MKNDKSKPTTNDAGIPVSSDEFSLTVGPDGPILLHDHYLIEQMANFNREMISDNPAPWCARSWTTPSAIG
jgi:catalase